MRRFIRLIKEIVKDIMKDLNREPDYTYERYEPKVLGNKLKGDNDNV